MFLLLFLFVCFLLVFLRTSIRSSRGNCTKSEASQKINGNSASFSSILILASCCIPRMRFVICSLFSSLFPFLLPQYLPDCDFLSFVKVYSSYDSNEDNIFFFTIWFLRVLRIKFVGFFHFLGLKLAWEISTKQVEKSIRKCVLLFFSPCSSSFSLRFLLFRLPTSGISYENRCCLS